MARRPALIKRKPKTARSTRSEQYLVNVKYLGDEPSNVTKENQSFAFNWYNTMCDKSEAREYLRDYFKARKRDGDVKKLAKLSDTWLPTSACWMARMLMRGGIFSESSMQTFDRMIAQAFKHTDETTEETAKPVVEKVSIQEKIKERQSDILGEIEALIDSGEPFSLYEWLQKNEIPALYTTAIMNHYKGWYSELLEALQKPDDQLKEAYRHMSRKELKDRLEMMAGLLEDAERYGSNTKKVKKPRKPRALSVEKILKHFRYQKEDNANKLASINPEKIIGAQELWTFNTKYKIVTVYRALDRGGLQINRSSITGYDEKNSFSKGVGRKSPEVILDKILNGGKLILRKVMDEMKTDKPLQNRVNENTILLKIVN